MGDVKVDDLRLPQAVVARIIKEALPPTVNVSKVGVKSTVVRNLPLEKRCNEPLLNLESLEEYSFCDYRVLCSSASSLGFCFH